MLVAIGTSTYHIVEQTTTTTSIERVETSTADYSKKLIKALVYLSLINQENEILLASLKRMEENKIKDDNAYLAKV